VALKNATNAFAAGDPPRTPLEELTMLPRTLVFSIHFENASSENEG